MAIHESIVSATWCRRTLLVVCALGLCGCNTVGPQSVSGGRGAYAEVMATTEDEQILNVIVRQRYDESFGMISVASITASLRFRAQAGTNIGIGDSGNYAGNLVPLSIGVAYEENPTISYVPLSGEDFMRRILAPVVAEEWLLAEGIAKQPGFVFDLGVRSINGIRNSLISDEPPSPKFSRVLEIYEEMRMAGVLNIARDPHTAGQGGFFWNFHEYGDKHLDKVCQLLDLLGIEHECDGSEIRLPVVMAFGPSSSAIHLQTRSAYDVLRIFGSGIDIPEAHFDAGIVEPVKWEAEEARQFIKIRSSDGDWWNSRPSNATVAIRFRDRWFYIDASDTKSKRAFQFLRTFVGIRLADPTASHRAPVLTVPVN